MASKPLNLSELYLQSMPIKLLVGLAITVVILVVGYFLIFSGQIDTLKKQKGEEATLKTDYTAKVKQAVHLPALKQELKELEESFTILLKQLPTDAEVPNLIQELHQAASNNSLQMSAVTPEATRLDPPVEVVPYAIVTNGSNEQLTKFAKDVGELSRIIVLTGLNIKANRNGQLDFSAKANTYKAAKDLPKGSAKP